MAVGPARGETVRSSSTVKRSPQGGSSTLIRSRLARKRRTWARISIRAVSDDYKVGDNKFTGKIHKVTIQVGKSNLSEEAQRAVEELRVKRAMAG